jgi:zinc and cadmium transporter
MADLTIILASVLVVSLISFTGLLVLALRKQLLESMLTYFVAFAAGALLSAVFFDLLPESVEAIQNDAYALALAGVFAFFIVERWIHWHHHAHHYNHGAEYVEHHAKGHVQPVAWLNIIGDALHNFADGVAIAASYLVSLPLGVVTTIAVVLHEIPQEIGDFSILIASGMKVRKALFYNFVSALSAVAGGLAGFWFLSDAQWATGYLVAFAAGGLLYVSVSDLLPGLHKETNLAKAVGQVASLLAGIAIIYAVSTLVGG